MKIIMKCALAALALTLLPATALTESSTIRILHDEPYGAIVTREAGVLVFRGLPPTRKVIVNPGGETPLVLESAEAMRTHDLADDRFVRASGARVIPLKP